MTNTIDLRRAAHALFAAHEDRLTHQIDVALAQLAAAELEGDELEVIAAQVKMVLDLAARAKAREHLKRSSSPLVIGERSTRDADGYCGSGEGGVDGCQGEIA